MLLSIFLTLLSTASDTTGNVQITVSTRHGRHTISEHIYGINGYGSSNPNILGAAGIKAVRWGGNRGTRYNWENDTINTASDWYFENHPNGANQGTSSFDSFVQANRTFKSLSIAQVPLLGWLPKSSDLHCSYSVAKYGQQKSVDPWATDCGNGIAPSGTHLLADPNDTSAWFGPDHITAWVRHTVNTFGDATHGGVQIWSLDNEPTWWNGVHADIHPNPASYDEMFNLGLQYALAIKAGDPAAAVSGPVAAGWESYFYSAADLHSGWSTAPYQYWSNPADRNAHGGVPFLEWYLDQMQAAEKTHGQRLLDYLDIHAYVTPSSSNTSEFVQAPRVLWDPNYVCTKCGFLDGTQTAPDSVVQLIPRMHEIITKHYPNTKLALTEYNFGGESDISGAIVQADILGVFGRYGVDLATIWADFSPGTPIFNAFKIYRNFDGRGGQFGTVGVDATSSDATRVSVYAAQRRNGTKLAVVLINKDATSTPAHLLLTDFAAQGAANVFQYTSADLQNIHQVADINLPQGKQTIVLPAYSITLVDILGQRI